MAANDLYTYTCFKCGHSVRRPGTSPPQECPACGVHKWKCIIEIEDKVAPPIDELGIVATGLEGDVVAERIAKDDGVTSATLSADMGHASEVTVDRQQRVTGFEDEGQAVRSLARTYNNLRGSQYHVEPKDEEDSEYADRVLVSSTDQPGRINVQVRNLDADMIAEIGRQGHFRGRREQDEVIAMIREAIADKHTVDAGIKAKTILLLTIPAPLGQGFRRHASEEAFDFRGFMDIWIAPFHEDPYPLTRR